MGGELVTMLLNSAGLPASSEEVDEEPSLTGLEPRMDLNLPGPDMSATTRHPRSPRGAHRKIPTSP